jgi:hypothetical protein
LRIVGRADLLRKGYVNELIRRGVTVRFEFAPITEVVVEDPEIDGFGGHDEA